MVQKGTLEMDNGSLNLPNRENQQKKPSDCITDILKIAMTYKVNHLCKGNQDVTKISKQKDVGKMVGLNSRGCVV